jgi:hypothetical protein
MREIPLTTGQIALVDDEDFEKLNHHIWYSSRGVKTLYARWDVNNKGERKTHYMHRAIIGKIPEGCEVDHIDGNGLNNQKSNLRIVTKRGNSQNRHHIKTSIYPGVSWSKNERKWVSMIQLNGICKNLGYFKIESEAHTTYRVACEVFGVA